MSEAQVNGASSGESVAADPAKAQEVSYEIPPALLQTMRGLVGLRNQEKIALADHVLAIFSGVAKIQEIQKAFDSRLVGFCSMHGIDPNNPAKGKWDMNLDLGRMIKLDK